MLQRRLKIGYPRAARLIDELEELGVVGPPLGGGREREVLISPEDEMEE
jgi:S-DNA-T family DNA segregation ATPase FtsK/SpoIIIE